MTAFDIGKTEMCERHTQNPLGPPRFLKQLYQRARREPWHICLEQDLLHNRYSPPVLLLWFGVSLSRL